ncbi:MAG: hypothetical protein U1E08_08055 [Coriobacteriia bacterium]|nr:hypothetical protein [Coriobacteriia bacterium]
MMTPGGAECAMYYEDFRRGASVQECRAGTDPRSADWQPTDCARCPVPEILAANGSPYLDVRITVRPGMLGFGRRVDVEVWCSLHGPIGGDPRTGCVMCNAEADDLLQRAFD